MMNMWLSNKLRFGFSLIILLSFVSCNGTNDAEFPELELPEEEQKTTFIYEDEFSEEEKVKLEEWISFTSDCAQKVLGRYPFDLYYHFHREDNPDYAVIFGHTARTDSTNAAHFYVDPTHSLEELKADWIAPHEISHLAIPKISRKHRWFVEGFATYMSREVMIEMGVFTREEVDSINQYRISIYTEYFTSSSKVHFVTDSLINDLNFYAPVYWMGASFFLKADKLLAEKGSMKLVEILTEFQVCCHKAKMSIEEVVAAFDKIEGSDLISTLYKKYTESPVNTLLLDY